MQIEVSVLLKTLRNLLRILLIDESRLKLYVDRSEELSLLCGKLHHLRVQLRLKMVKSARARCVHHHPVDLCLGVGSIKHDWLVLQILGAFHLFLGLLGAIVFATAFARLEARLLDLFVLQNMHESDSCHVSVVRRLVVVR